MFALVLAGVVAALAVPENPYFAASWPHYAVSSVLIFMVLHTLAKSYDLDRGGRALHASIFEFVVKPALVTFGATTFGYLVERTIAHSQGAVFGAGPLAPEHWIILLATVAVASERLVGLWLLRRWQAAGHLSTNVVIFGADTIGQRLVKLVCEEYSDSVRILGIYDDRAQRVPTHAQGIPVEGGIEDLIEYVKAVPSIDKVLIALPMRAEQRILDLLTRLRSLAIDVALVPDFVSMRLDRQVTRDSHPPILSVLRKPQSEFDWLVKRSFDFTTSLLLLIALSPLLALTALAIRLESPGPILFRQPRLGLNNREFNVLKFRSMYAEQSDLAAKEQTKRNDPRVTRVGAWIRKCSVDELPQLFNVLAGDMSLVGPRPHALGMQVKNRLCDEIVREYAVRHRMRPGITGWAQVRGLRGAVEEPAVLEARVDHDIYYIDNWSFLFDLRILMMTAIELIRPRNAF
ncbi:MAG TPA: undecaprenyl-phosphate glucose phosphotransferase [Dongiaceae bacterium]|nr:undecaprenyl-phosphate glucose phosphotransferase [Dongiaceae bacterium]